MPGRGDDVLEIDTLQKIQIGVGNRFIVLMRTFLDSSPTTASEMMQAWPVIDPNRGIVRRALCWFDGLVVVVPALIGKAVVQAQAYAVEMFGVGVFPQRHRCAVGQRILPFTYFARGAEQEPPARLQRACHVTQKLPLVSCIEQENEADRYGPAEGPSEEFTVLRWLTGGRHIGQVAPVSRNERGRRIDSPH